MTVEAIKLKVIGPDGSISELSLQQNDSVIVGSGASANICLEDPKISSIHAMVKSEEETVKAIDLGSEFGTRVAGQEIREKDLTSGDILEIGNYKVQVTWGPESDLSDAASTEVYQAPRELVSSEQEGEGVAPSRPEESDVPSVAPESQWQESSSDREVVERESPVPAVSSIFAEVIPPDERPSANNRMLEVAMIWSDTVIGMGHFNMKETPVTIGEGKKNDFLLSSELLSSPVYPLITSDGADHVVSLGKGFIIKVRDEKGNILDRGDLESANLLTSSGGGQAYKIGLNDQVQVSIGDTSLVVRYVRPSKKIAGSFFATFDYYFTKVFSTSLMGHLLFIAALILTPTDLERLSDDLFTNPNRFAKLIIEPPLEEEQLIEELVEEEEKPEEETEFGEEIVEDKPPPEDVEVIDIDQREQDLMAVMDTGLMSALDDDVFGAGGMGAGINEALGGLDGEGADAAGMGGLGSRGTGMGAGGALGIGGLGTKGGGGRGGHGSVDLGGRGRKATKVSAGRTIVEGGLDREVIARIVNRHRNAILYCYNRELARDPNLEGRIAVMWVIDGTGAVASATIADTTMGNANVENCILQRVRRWNFPEPRGGGIVRVTYPWIFTRS